jgi:phospholipase C
LARLFALCLAAVCAWGQPQAPRGAPAATVPKFSHVVVIAIENKEFEDVVGKRRMPNFNRWAGRYALLTQYYAVSHPSLPNYLALISGQTFGAKSDCTDCFVDAPCLPDLLEAAGRTWKAYLEGLPVAGFLGTFSGQYAMKHNAFVYFQSIRRDAARRARSVVPLTELAADLSRNALPDYAFIMPDMCNSSHDCDIDVTDAWLGRVVNEILRSPAFGADGLIVLTFDEGTTVRSCCGSPPLARGGRIATVLISDLVKPSSRDATPYSHYSLLKTILASWGLGDLGRTSDPEVNLILAPWQVR